MKNASPFPLTTLRWLLLGFLQTSFSMNLMAADPFAENVRTTDPLTPAEEVKAFHLPPGFEIQLFASEPDIGKPMNMAFDEKGRLWVTISYEYPFPVPLGKPARDVIRILEDTDGDGKADKITTFAEGLNIPTGIYPYKNRAVGWSIPNIWSFEDTDGDGKADKRDVLFGPLGWERDTHGMDSSFRRGFDGWLYITHGFNNNTTVHGKDGSEIKMNSGNTYRVRLDGSRVEQNTFGQVNPFGLCFDPLGNLYSADCHSAPIYQLLRGGYYPSFGKPHDGLGFAPVLMEHSHGSTAIAGIIYYSDDQWPAEYRDNMFVGNVMTSRVNRDHLIFDGSSPTAKEMPDFLSTDDPWFRPVDLQMGPDGALYISDFYNRIIGHYEVPLTHPGRDRQRGRIWRVVYRGKDGQAPPARSGRFDLTKLSMDEIIAELGGPNQTRRMLALNYLVDTKSDSAAAPVKAMMQKGDASALQKASGLWVLHRLEALDESILTAACKDADRLLRTHAMRVLSETLRWNQGQHDLAAAGLKDSDASVQRAAADAMGQHPAFDQIKPLLALLSSVPKKDTHLRYTARMALRNQVNEPGSLDRLQASGLQESDARAIADVAVAVPSAEAGAFLLWHVQRYPEAAETLSRYLRHVARYAPEGKMDELAAFVRRQFQNDVDFQQELFKSVQDGTAQRGAALSQGVKAWGEELAGRLFNSVDQTASVWHSLPVEGMPVTAIPWFVQKRASSDGDKESLFICSLPPGGEQLTGVLRSKSFSIPSKLSFFFAGHDGYPDKPAQKRNVVRLRLSENDQVMAASYPPRNDVAQIVSWDLSACAGKSGYLELVDGDNGNAYAWLAVGRFNPAVVPLPEVDPSLVSRRQQSAAELVGNLGLSSLEPKLAALLQGRETGLEIRVAAARALIVLKPNETLAALAPVIGDATISSDLREKIVGLLVNRGDAQPAVADVFRSTPYRVQVGVAQVLAGSPKGAEVLLKTVEQGQASPRLLLERSIKDKLAASVASKDQVEHLVKGLAPASEQTQKLIESRRSGYQAHAGKAQEGEKVFRQTCAVCHTIDGQGGLVGPQLDGIGNRGLERLLEDVLDPNRNVDRAFRTHVIVLKDGDVVSGLPRREEGEILVLADSTGKEVSVQKKEIQSRRESESSLMPDNFGEALSQENFYDLMSFLLSKRANPPRN